jgi:hypothetical protein
MFAGVRITAPIARCDHFRHGCNIPLIMNGPFRIRLLAGFLAA